MFDPDRANLDEMLTWNGQLKSLGRPFLGPTRSPLVRDGVVF